MARVRARFAGLEAHGVDVSVKQGQADSWIPGRAA